MLVSVALAFFAASASPAQAALPTAPSPAAKPRKVCRSEAVIGSITPKRVCTVLPPRDAARPQSNAQTAGSDQKAPAPESSTGNN